MFKYFLEEVDGVFPEGARYQLNEEQARRLTSAAALLHMLESQLRDELDILQSNLTNQEGRNKPPPLSLGMLDRLVEVPMTIDMICEQPSCPICSEDYATAEQVMKLPCSHLYHKPCVMPWLEAKRTCPICRFELLNEVPEKSDLEKLSSEELKNRISTRDQCIDVDSMESQGRSVLVDRLHSLLVKEKEEHDSLEFQTSRESSEQSGIFGMAYADSRLGALMQRRHMEMRARHLGTSSSGLVPMRLSRPDGDEQSITGNIVTNNSSTHNVPTHASYPVGRLMGAIPRPMASLQTHGGRYSDSDEEEWEPTQPYHVSGSGPVRVLRMSGGGPVVQIRSSGGPSTSSNTVLNSAMRRITQDDAQDESDMESGICPYRVISNPQHRHGDSSSRSMTPTPTSNAYIPTGDNIRSRISTSTIPTRTTYILRTVDGSSHATAVPLTQSSQSTTMRSAPLRRDDA
eukprot:CAMPEP_0185041584 /NCGR_PEP_ID=MMETSP1103-20130426/41079_1 /TAXON_ID=36769 /ORGANISM="Paraphysomonas bandaiensis, Strain Caron Lab Isolate" /LENGTH=458 /DNA_ID=CAMNT_0027581385 /DNA_START=209 /DNA_END=1586 /DNA_ORIENTATION=+